MVKVIVLGSTYDNSECNGEKSVGIKEKQRPNRRNVCDLKHSRCFKMGWHWFGGLFRADPGAAAWLTSVLWLEHEHEASHS